MRALRSGTEFNTILSTVGSHPGDLERFQVTLLKGPNSTYTVESATFEAHGIPRTYPASQVKWYQDTHAMISVALNGHSIWNESIVGNPEYDVEITDIVGVGAFFGTETPSNYWYPHSQSKFVLLGLDSNGQPVNDQVWSAFCGRLGDSFATKLEGAISFLGKNLASPDWTYVQLVWNAALLIGKIGQDLLWADGPDGPGARAWVNPLPAVGAAAIISGLQGVIS